MEVAMAKRAETRKRNKLKKQANKNNTSTKRKSKITKKRPAFRYFCAKHRKLESFKLSNPQGTTEVVKKKALRNIYMALTEKEKAPYYALQAEDKQRFDHETAIENVMNDMIDYVIEPDPIKRKQMQHSMKSTNAHRTNTFHKPEAHLSPFMIYCQVHLSQVQKQFDSMVYQEFQERQETEHVPIRQITMFEIGIALSKNYLMLSKMQLDLYINEANLLKSKYLQNYKKYSNAVLKASSAKLKASGGSLNVGSLLQEEQIVLDAPYEANWNDEHMIETLFGVKKSIGGGDIVVTVVKETNQTKHGSNTPMKEKAGETNAMAALMMSLSPQSFSSSSTSTFSSTSSSASSSVASSGSSWMGTLVSSHTTTFNDNITVNNHNNHKNLQALLSNNGSSSSSSSSSNNFSKRKTRCGKCDGCTTKDCGICKYCMDKPKRGGNNTLRKPCELRVCTNLMNQGNDSKNQPRKIDQYQIQSTEMEERLISKSSITPVDPFLIEKIQLKNILSGQVAHQGLMEYNNQRKQTSAKKKRKMNKPKPPTAWVFFMKYSRPNVLQTHPNAGFGEISSYVSQLWNELSVQDKEPFFVASRNAKKAWK